MSKLQAWAQHVEAHVRSMFGAEAPDCPAMELVSDTRERMVGLLSGYRTEPIVQERDEVVLQRGLGLLCARCMAAGESVPAVAVYGGESRCREHTATWKG